MAMFRKVPIALVMSALVLALITPSQSQAAPPAPNILIDPGNSGTYSGTGATVNSIGSSTAQGTMSNVTYNSSNGGYFAFTGSSSYISFPSAYQFGNTFTISAWVRQTGTPTQIQALMGNAASGGSANGFKAFWNEYNTNNRKLVLETGNQSANGFSVTSGAAVAASGWQQVTFVVNRNTGTTAIYVNGVAQNMGNNAIRTDFATNQAWFIGAFTDGTFSLNGHIGVFEVFNSALSASDVTASYATYSSRYIAQNPVITVSAPFSLSNPATYRSTVTISLTSNAAGRIGLRANGKWIPNCRAIAITTSATCSYRPSLHGVISLSAIFTPTNSSSFNPVTVAAQPFAVVLRTNNR
jgi:hypothetical protein